MESIRIFLVIVLVTGIIWREISASLYLYIQPRKSSYARKPILSRRMDILNEARAAFAGAGREVRFNLAPSYGSLNSETLKEIDESLKVMMGGILEMGIYRGVTWNEVRYALDSNPLVLRQPYMSVSKMGRITFGTYRLIGFDADEKKKMFKICSWFRRFIGNVDILEDTDIDLYSLANMISEMTLYIMGNIFTNRLTKMNLMDLGILRFPDISQPFFTLYRINLMAKCRYSTYVVHQKKTCHLLGLFQKEVYYPNQDYINQLSNDVMDQLLNEVDDLFGVS